MNKHGLYDVYEHVHIPFWQTSYFTYSIIALCILLIGLSICYYLKRRKKAQLPIWALSIDDIESLKRNNLARADKGKEFYSELTSILKKYLYRRFAVDSIGKTDAELIRYLNAQKFSVDLTQELQEIFSGVTIIKFANVQAAQEQIDRDIQRSIMFIKKTVPTQK
jgi:short subunit fatty acids transporter